MTDQDIAVAIEVGLKQPSPGAFIDSFHEGHQDGIAAQQFLPAPLLDGAVRINAMGQGGGLAELGCSRIQQIQGTNASLPDTGFGFIVVDQREGVADVEPLAAVRRHEPAVQAAIVEVTDAEVPAEEQGHFIAAQPGEHHRGQG